MTPTTPMFHAVHLFVRYGSPEDVTAYMRNAAGLSAEMEDEVTAAAFAWIMNARSRDEVLMGARLMATTPSGRGLLEDAARVMRTELK